MQNQKTGKENREKDLAEKSGKLELLIPLRVIR